MEKRMNKDELIQLIENPAVDADNEKVIRSINGFEFMINGTMARILNERYLKKYSIDSLRKVKEIADLKIFLNKYQNSYLIKKFRQMKLQKIHF